MKLVNQSLALAATLLMTVPALANSSGGDSNERRSTTYNPTRTVPSAYVSGPIKSTARPVSRDNDGDTDTVVRNRIREMSGGNHTTTGDSSTPRTGGVMRSR